MTCSTRKRDLHATAPAAMVTGPLVAVGLVTIKNGVLESKDDLQRRIEEAARYVPVDQLCLSPQCEFSSTVEGNALTRDEQVAKLALIVELLSQLPSTGASIAELARLVGVSALTAHQWAHELVAMDVLTVEPDPTSA